MGFRQRQLAQEHIWQCFICCLIKNDCHQPLLCEVMVNRHSPFILSNFSSFLLLFIFWICIFVDVFSYFFFIFFLLAHAFFSFVLFLFFIFALFVILNLQSCYFFSSVLLIYYFIKECYL